MPRQKKSVPESKTSKPKEEGSHFFPVVGIGASAGGLDAFKRLLKAIPEKSGMAYVIVQHLDPMHESMLPELLGKITDIPIVEITDKISVKPDHIYIIPPNKILTASDGKLNLAPRNLRNLKNDPIDVFFISLAEVYQSMAVGVVLSGTAHDGTAGLKAIKENGGITIAQDEATAAFGSMPQSAKNAGVVDFVLPPEKIPGQLQKINQTYQKTYAIAEKEELPETDENIFKQILVTLRPNGVDFTYYKKPTIRRRIARRMALSHKEKLAEYLAFLRKDKDEQASLFRDLLIPVTSFFRDAKAYQLLKEKVLPAVIKNKPPNESIRIWVAGCSTGEEAYSVAICLHEYLSESHDKTHEGNIQIFGTDISAESIAKARTALYSKKDLEDVSEDRLQRYFVKLDGGYHVQKFIRQMCVFAVHNFFIDPPFGKMDLITCRNLLIYVETYLQKKAFTTFHYALREKGIMMLGKSESVSVSTDLFSVFDRQEKFFSRKPGVSRFIPLAPDKNEKTHPREMPSQKQQDKQTDFQKVADAVLLSQYTPSGVVVNDQADIVYYHGPTGSFLEPASGTPSLNVVKLAREGLSFEIRNALRRASHSRVHVIKENISVRKNGKTELVTIEVIPLNTVEPHFLILFRKQATIGPALSLKGAKGKRGDKSSLRIEQLEKDAEQARKDMRFVTEDQQAAIEELQSANEELQSANEELLSNAEELQSLNEELETSKEELQSGNEELVILNQELTDRQLELDSERSYSEAIVTTIREPLIVLDRQLRVRSANAAFYREYKLTDQETIGYSFFEISNRLWDDAELRVHLEQILPKKTVLENFEIKLTPFYNQRNMLINARQVVDEKNVEPFILLAIEDITTKKLAEEKVKLFAEKLKQTNAQLEQFANVVSHDLQEPLRKIVTYSSQLLENKKNISAEVIENLIKIEGSAKRQAKLIQDLLSYARITNLEKLFTPVDLNEIFKHIIDDFELLIKEKKAVVKSDPLPVIEAIPAQMNQLFYNLISNGLKFSVSETPPVIHVSSRELPAQEIPDHPHLGGQPPHCELTFEDNGIGFNQKYAEQVFTIFERLNNPGEYAGTGIGLALTKKIVENHEGEIYIKTKEKKGTSIHVILPMKQSRRSSNGVS